jgi:hypothetical protein
MVSQLSAEDRALIEELRAFGVFQDIDEHRLDQSNGVMLITCSDGDRFPDIFQHQARMQADCRPDPRIHVFAWHGGVLACAPVSPINARKDAHRVFLDQITVARSMKQIDVIPIYAHAPCGAAALNHVGLEQVLTLQFEAKNQIKKENPGIVVFPFFHVDYGDGKCRSYFLSRQKWEEWVLGQKA